MARRTALLLGGTKMVERHVRRALPTDTDMVEVRSIEAALKRMDEEEVSILVFGPTLRRSLALVATLRGDVRTARTPLVVVYRDDQRTEVSRHLEGRHRADAYVIQSRAQRELEQAIAAALHGTSAAPDLHIASEQLEALPLGSVSALTQDISSVAHAAALAPVVTTLELDAIEIEEVGGDDASESATQMLDIVALDDDEPPLELGAGDFIEVSTGQTPIVEDLEEADGIDEADDPGSAAGDGDDQTVLPDELPLDSLDAELLSLGEEEGEADDDGQGDDAADEGEVELIEMEELDDVGLDDDDVDDADVDDADVGLDDDDVGDDDVGLDDDDLRLDDDDASEGAVPLDDAASILDDLDDIEELAEIEPFEVSTVTDLEVAAPAEPATAFELPAATVSAAPGAGAGEVDGVVAGGEEPDVAEEVDALVVESADEADVAEAVDADAVESAEEPDVAGHGRGAGDAVTVARAEAPSSRAAQAAPGAAGAAPADAVPPHRQRHASSSELLSSNLSELTTLIGKLQTALADIDRLEAENAELRSQAGGAAADGLRAEVAAARAAEASAQARAAAAVAEVERLRAAASAAAAAAAADVGRLQGALEGARAAQAAAQAEVAGLRAAATADAAAVGDAKTLLQQALSRLGA